MTIAIDGRAIADGNSGIVEVGIGLCEGEAFIEGDGLANSVGEGEKIGLGRELGIAVGFGVNDEVGVGANEAVGVGVTVGVGVDGGGDGDETARHKAAYAAPVGLMVKFARFCDIIGSRRVCSWKKVWVSSCGVQVK